MSSSSFKMEARHFCRFCKSLRSPSTELRHMGSISPQTRSQRRYTSTSDGSRPSQRQAHPLGDYYASILSQPLTKKTSTKGPVTRSQPSTSPAINTTPATAREEPMILFSSRLSSPLERRSEIMKKSTLIAGVLVPPRPDEPDNCCMSGCVNCVWDRYRDEIEEWAAARRKADTALQREARTAHERRKRKGTVGSSAGSGLMLGGGEKGAQHTMTSMDDDGGGSETNWNMESVGDDLFSGIPVGIKEFMKTEKRLREKHMRDRAIAAAAGGPATPAPPA